nr:hypothetical protein Iba_chr07bCG11010 [Ipomoea batatas]GMD16488.1 hypothetical protein Iba_chr07cCG9880 [Ipomoea batatas]GMD19404.1 hypothetical protein Iba_chr07eCG7910 [Ipomoea batatas]GMD20755.1 hypothetical protein Iba_chr07fCG7720 [Ipomoea batatas]
MQADKKHEDYGSDLKLRIIYLSVKIIKLNVRQPTRRLKRNEEIFSTHRYGCSRPPSPAQPFAVKPFHFIIQDSAKAANQGCCHKDLVNV